MGTGVPSGSCLLLGLVDRASGKTILPGIALAHRRGDGIADQWFDGSCRTRLMGVASASCSIVEEAADVEAVGSEGGVTCQP